MCVSSRLKKNIKITVLWDFKNPIKLRNKLVSVTFVCKTSTGWIPEGGVWRRWRSLYSLPCGPDASKIGPRITQTRHKEKRHITGKLLVNEAHGA